MSRFMPNEDVLVRLQRDLRRALKTDPGQVKWIMVIDRAKCVGCNACTIACVAGNKLPPVAFRRGVNVYQGHGRGRRT